jgi:hypothetical protein
MKGAELPLRAISARPHRSKSHPGARRRASSHAATRSRQWSPLPVALECELVWLFRRYSRYLSGNPARVCVIPLVALPTGDPPLEPARYLVFDPTHGTLPHCHRAGELAARGCFQNTSISASISRMRIARRVIDIPNDANAMYLLSLRLTFSVDESKTADCIRKCLRYGRRWHEGWIALHLTRANTASLATLIRTFYCTYADLATLLAGNVLIYLRVNIEVTIM